MRGTTRIRIPGEISQNSEPAIKKLHNRLKYEPVSLNIAKRFKSRKETAFHEQISLGDPWHRSGID